ncbi:6581_t:CDS:2, partial [Gigaspora margarita]
MLLSPTSPFSKDPGELTPSHNYDISNGSHNQHTKSHYNIYNSDFDSEEVVDVDIEDDDEFFLDDKGYDAEAPEIPFPRKDSITNFDGDKHNVSSIPAKKKKKNKSALSISQMNTNNNEEWQQIREFWLQLGEKEQWSLVKVEKEAFLKKMKEKQNHSCSCS